MTDHTDLLRWLHAEAVWQRETVDAQYRELEIMYAKRLHERDRLRAEIDRLRAERAALWTMLKRQTRRVQRWRRWTMDANTEITRLRDLGQQLCAAIGVPDAVEPIGWARDMRAQLERLRAATTEVRR